MIRATNYETVSKVVKVMPKILWPLFFRTRCRWPWMTLNGHFTGLLQRNS